MNLTWFQSAVQIRNHLRQKLAQDWTTAGRDWVDVDIVQNHGASVELRLRFTDEDGEDSNLFTLPISSRILDGVRRYLHSTRAYLYQFFIEDLGGGRRAYRFGVVLTDRPNYPNDSDCEG